MKYCICSRSIQRFVEGPSPDKHNNAIHRAQVVSQRHRIRKAPGRLTRRLRSAHSATSSRGLGQSKKKEAGALKKCGKCRIYRYCSRECQTEDWRQGHHKLFCDKAGEIGSKSEIRGKSLGMFALRDLKRDDTTWVKRPSMPKEEYMAGNNGIVSNGAWIYSNLDVQSQQRQVVSQLFHGQSRLHWEQPLKAYHSVDE